MPFMGRWCCCVAAGLCLTVAQIGCTTTQTGQSLGTSAPKPQATGAGLTTGDLAEGPGRAAHRNPATIDLIESELRDAPPVERDALLKSLRDLPDETVKHVLNERRKGLQSAARQRPGPRLRGGEQASVPMVQPTGAETASIADPLPPLARRHSQNGLGTISAWGQSPPKRVERGSGGADQAPMIQPADPVDPADADLSQQEAGIAHLSSETQPSARPQGTGHAQGYRSEVPNEVSAATAVGGAAKNGATTPPASGKANPILGYLLPGRFGGAQPAAGKMDAFQRGKPESAASVAVGVPRETTAGPGVSANDGAGANSTTTRELLDRLITSAESDVARLRPGEDSETRAYIEKHVSLRMLYLMSGRQERALQAIPGIDQADQEFWQQTFWGLANYFDVESIPESADRAAQAIARLTNAVLRLQEKANLELRNVNFCYKIASFGNYEKYPRDEFGPGQEVLLYAEIANTRSEPTADGRYRTSLKSTLEVCKHGSDEDLVERIELPEPETIDLCRTHRRDYFHSYVFTIPSRLTLGPHVLKLTVEDQISRRSATYSLNFTVR
jgi:hypothetical protein